MELLQNKLWQEGYVDYNDPIRCIRRGCRHAPLMVCILCQCSSMCKECFKEYEQDPRFNQYCPICLLPATGFTEKGEGGGGTTNPNPPPAAVPRNTVECPACHSEAVRRVSKSAANPNRPYWACPNWCKGVWIGWINK